MWLLLTGLLGVYSRLTLPPQGIHQGAQCDRASFAWNFAYTDGNILRPHIQETRFGNGLVAGEFPLVPYTVSLCYRAFGFHNFWFRSVNWLLLSLGVWCAFLITGFFINNLLHRLSIMVIWVLSPILLFYGPSFLSDTSGLAFSLMSWYFLLRWRFRMRPADLVAGILLLGLAGLVKITFSAGLFPAALLVFLQLRGHDTGLRKWILPGAVLLLSAISILSWYRYAAALNAATGNVHFLLNAKPAGSLLEARELSVSIFRNWLEQFYPGPFVFSILI
ncbi:MAG: glycosyltransferase family 39 protein, partial [Bacteroidetes bacterium]|nr:glycosyltransferase family 39 protein [Bacteroidota bacterium]